MTDNTPNLSQANKVSPIWIVPLLALLIAGWLALKAWQDKGPEVRIVFDGAAGITVGKTQVKFRDVVVGKVTDIKLTNDFQKVTTLIELDPQVKSLVSEFTRFWVVSPRISLGGVSGLDTLLSGVSIKQLNQLGSENGYSFTAEAGCYPAIYEAYSKNCFWGKHKGGKYKNKPVINNFGIKGKFYETPKREMGKHNETQYGLEQALRDSLNTWYVWMYEMTDQTLLLQGDVAGVPDTRALVTGALDQVRPINKLMRSVGFGQALDLSGSLLPVDYDWRVWDVLWSSSTQEEAVTDRHTLRQMSIGLRSYVTPLNMALVSASIASEHWVKPILLSELIKPIKSEGIIFVP